MIPAEHALSPKSGHGSNVTIEWGLVQVPIKLHLLNDTDRSVPRRSQFVTVDGEDHPVGYKNYDKVTGDDVAAADIVKKVEVDDGKWVELTDAEIEEHTALTPGVATITTFVPLSDFGQLYVVEKYGVWRPATMKSGKNRIVNPAAGKAYALLTAAMRARDVAALVLVPSKSGGQYVALFADGRAAWMAFAENVRYHADPEESMVTDAELQLAEQLIDGIGVSTPVLRDEAGERIRKFLAAKAENPEAVTASTAPADTPNVVDLASLLAASVEAATAKKAPAKRAGKKAS